MTENLKDKLRDIAYEVNTLVPEWGEDSPTIPLVESRADDPYRYNSPEDMLDTFCAKYLGHAPESTRDWVRLVVFLTVNTDRVLARKTVPVVCRILNVPLDSEDINRIINRQLLHKKGKQ